MLTNSTETEDQPIMLKTIQVMQTLPTQFVCMCVSGFFLVTIHQMLMSPLIKMFYQITILVMVITTLNNNNDKDDNKDDNNNNNKNYNNKLLPRPYPSSSSFLYKLRL